MKALTQFCGGLQGLVPWKRALALIGLLMFGAFPAEAASLALLEYRLTGSQLTVSPPNLSVPKGIAGSILVELTSGGSTNRVPVSATEGVYVSAILRGPAFPAREVTGPLNGALLLPPLNLVGDYELNDIKLVEAATGRVQLEGVPSRVPVHVFDEVLVSRVTSRALSLDEVREKGIAIDEKNFRAVEFEVGFVLDGKTIPVRFPVVAPTFRQSTEIIPRAELEAQLAAASIINQQLAQGATLPKELETARLNMQVQGINFQVVDEVDSDLKLSIPPIPALIVIPGNIGFLNQFFSVQVFTENGAPIGSGLSVRQVKASLQLPTGPDLVAGTSYENPGDDPLRFARIGPGKVIQPVQPVVGLGPDGRPGTADDMDRLRPGESGQAEFLVEGLQEGLHVMNLDLTADLEGLAAGIVHISGKAAGSVLVRNPRFSLTFAHPRTTRQGEPYDATVTVLNTGNTIANLVRVTLPATSISGGELKSADTVEIGSLQPGQSGTAKFRVKAQKTGQISFSNLTTGREATAGAFQLTMGIDERGVALSPDSIAMPDYVTQLPQGVVDAANRVLGQALSISVAAQLPAGVQTVPKSIITRRVLELSEAGQRLQYGDLPGRVLMDLLLDWQGAREFEPGFDQILRVTDAGREWRDALAAALESSDHLAPGARLSAIGADLAGRSESWLLFSADSPAAELGFGDADTGPQPQLTAPPRSVFYRGALGVWGVVKPSAGSVAQWSFSSNVTTASIAALLLETNGAGRRFVWNPQLNGAGGCLSFRPNGNTSGFLSLDPGCTGSSTGSISSPAILVTESAPRVIAVVQDLTVEAGQPRVRCGDSQGAGGDNYGTVLAALFSKPMTQETVNQPEAYRLENGNVAGSVQIQPGGRVALLNMRLAVGTLRPRALTVSGVADLRGHPVSGPAVPVSAAATNGIAIRGRAVRADGTPAGGIPVTLTMYDNQVVGLSCDSHVVRVSQVFTDPSGLFDFDFILTGVSYSISATDTSGLTSEAVSLILDSTTADEFQSGQLSQRIASHPDSLLAAFGAAVASEAIARAEGLDRAVLRDRVERGSPRTGSEVPVSLVFRGRAAVTGSVVGPDGSTPQPGAAVNLFPDPDSRELGRGVFSDAGGRFAFEGVPLGVFTIAVTNNQGRFRVVSDVISQPGERREVQVVLSTNTVVRSDLGGRVVEANNTTGHSAARVFVGRYSDSGFGGVVAVATADSDGYWTTPGIPAGSYDVIAVSADGRRKGERRSVPVAPGSSAQITISLQGFSTVHGRVENHHGQPVADALVAGGSELVRTDEAGLFTLQGVPTGRRVISAGLESDPADSNSFARIGSATVEVVDGAPNSVVVRLDPHGTIFGRILDAIGKPVPHAQVRIPQQGGFLYVDADERGIYRFVGLPLDRYTLSSSDEAAPVAMTDASKLVDQIQTGSENQILAAFGEAVRIFTGVDDPLLNGSGQSFNPGTFGFTQAELVEDGQVVESDIHFIPVGSVSGVVLNGQGFRIGAKVRLTTLGLDGKGAPTTVLRGDVNSDAASGEFAFAGLVPAGPWGLQAASPFFSTVISVAGQTSNPGHLDETNVVLRFPLDQDTKGSLTGVVYNPDGTPVGEGISVSLPAQPVVGVRRTDAGGRYEFNAVSQGFLQVIAEDAVRGLKGEALVDLKAGLANAGDVRLLGKGSVVVNVFQADGVTPVSGASVALEQGSFPRDTVSGNRTDASGAATLANLFEGSYAVCAQSGSGISTLYGRSAVSIRAGETTTVSVKLTPTATLAGRFVLRDLKTPVASAQVAIGSIGFAVTDSDGRFVVGGIPLGTYRLVSQNPVSGVAASTTVALLVNNATNVVTLVEESRGEVDGFVVGSYGTNLVAGAMVSIRFDDGITPSRSVTTGNDGGFRFPGSPAGTFQLAASDPVRGFTGSAVGFLAEGQLQASQNVRLQPLGSVALQFLASDSLAPARNVHVVLSGDGGFSGSKDADIEGRVSFADLPLGTYHVVAKEIQRSGLFTNVVVSQAGQLASLSLTLPGIGRVNGRVLLSNGSTPAAGVTVVLTEQVALYSGEQETVFTGLDGRFSFTNVAVGAYQVAAVSQSLGASVGGSIASRGEVDEISLTLGASGRISGRVVRADGRTPVIGSEILLTSTTQSGLGGRSLGRSDTLGKFTFDTVPVGPIQLEIAAASIGGLARVTRVLSSNGELLALGDVFLDEESPEVLQVSPPNFAVGVSTSTSVDILFSEAIHSNRLDSAGVFLRSSAGPVDSTLALLADTNGVQRILRLTPRTRLKSETVYDLVVVDGDRRDEFGGVVARGPVDLVDRPLQTPFLSRFVTADNDPPVLISAFPAEAAVQVDSRAVMRLEFNEPVKGTNLVVRLVGPHGPVPGTTTFGPNGLTLLFAPDAALELNAAFTLTASNIVDLAENSAVGQPFVIHFGSLDTLGPDVSSLQLLGGVSPVAGRRVTLEAALAAPEADVQVRFQRVQPDFQNLGAVTASPFRIETTLPSSGVVTYQAIATDHFGNDGTNRLLVLQVASNQPPSVTLTRIRPATGPVFKGEPFSVQVAASDDVAVTNILFVATGGGLAFTTNIIATNLATVELSVPTDAPTGSSIQVAARALDFAGVSSQDAVISLEVRKVNHRPIAGAPVFGPAGALELDGLDDIAYGFVIDDVRDNFTMELWVNPSASRGSTSEATDGIGALGNQRYAIFPAHGAAFTGPGSHAGAGISVGTNGVTVAEHAPSYLPPLLVYDGPITGWTHVAVVYEQNRPSLFVNGVLVRQGLQSARTVHPSCGFSDFPPYGDYRGTLDEVRIWRGARSVSEIRDGMTLRMAGTERDLVSCFRLDESGGPTLTNQVPGRSSMELGSAGASPARVVSTAPFSGRGILTNIGGSLQPLLLTASDPDGDALTISILSLPAHGRLFQTADGTTRGSEITNSPAVVLHPAGIVLFQRDLSYLGADEFRFVANDGITDSFEAIALLNLAPPADLDSDGDGMPDLYEIQHGLNPAVADAALDTDGDGWTNLVEYGQGTDPRNRDTDGDGIPDSLDPEPLVASFQGVSLEAALYARATDPVQLAFAPDGTLYLGVDASGSGGGSGAAVKIHRIFPGGAITEDFGSVALEDPDGVVVDVSGSFSGVPGSVLVAGSGPTGLGMIRAIHPDQTVSIVAGPSSAFTNPQTLRIDPQGRLLFLDFGAQKGVWSMAPGGSPSLLVPSPGGTSPFHMAVDPQGRICVSDAEGALRVYQPNGDLLDGHLASGLANAYFCYGPGGVFGRSLWVVDDAGRLLTIDASGLIQVRLIGLGTTNTVGDLLFGPDGALYLGDFGHDRILRIAPALAPDATTSAWPQRRILPVVGTPDLWDVRNGTRLTESSGAGPGSLEDALGARTATSPEPGHGFFPDGQPDGFVHWMEWRTASPVFVNGFRLLAMSDGGGFRGKREFREFRLLARPFGEAEFKLIYTRQATNPYPNAIDIGTEGYLEWIDAVNSIIAQEFRAEFVQSGSGGSSGPRILELDGFGEAVSAGACVQPPSGLLHWYRGEDGGRDSAGTAHGSYSGAAGAPGKVGSGLEFDGASGGMAMGNASNPDLDFGPDDSFTLETWFNSYGPSPSGQEGEIIIALNYACSPTVQSIVLQNGGKLFFQVRDVNNLTAYTGAPRLISRNEWHHIIAVREVVAGVKTLRMYLDGELVDAVHDPSTGSLANEGALDQVGQRNRCGDFGFFYGAIDEVSIYGRALSPTEVLAQYAAGVAGKCPACAPMPAGAVALWKAEGDVTDSVGGLNGTISGGVVFGAGEVGQAFRLDGVDAVVSIPDSPALSPHLGPQGEMSLGAWVYIDSYPEPDPITQQGRRSFVSKGNTGNFEYALSLTIDGSAQFSVWSPLGGTYAEPAGGTLSLHRWHHVVGTMVKGEFVAVYLDGVEAARSTVRPVDTGHGNAPLLIGRRGDGSGFKGGVDEVSLYQRALSLGEIEALYAAGAAGTCVDCATLPQGCPGGPSDPPTSVAIGGVEVLAGVGGGAESLAFAWSTDWSGTFAIEASSDLVQWELLPATVTQPTAGSYRAVVRIEPGFGARFFRLRAVIP